MKTEEEILKKYHTIAIVGASPDPERYSHTVMRYLRDHGYKVIPVNPTVPKVLGLKSYPNLTSVPEKIDIVDVFRAPEKVMPTIDEAIAIGAKVLWLQEGVVNKAAAERAKKAGLVVVMDRCIMKAHMAMTDG